MGSFPISKFSAVQLRVSLKTKLLIKSLYLSKYQIYTEYKDAYL